MRTIRLRSALLLLPVVAFGASLESAKAVAAPPIAIAVAADSARLPGPERQPRQSLIDKAVPPEILRRPADGQDDPLKGYCEWPDRYRSGASEEDKTDYWAAIAVSPSTGKYASSCAYRPFDLASRAAREKCDAPDARTVVLCGNGWCALALGEEKPGKEFGWGVGWGPDRQTAERYALEGARAQKLRGAKVVYSIFSREPRTGGAIAYSVSTGRWGYSTGGGRYAPAMAFKNCTEPDAEIIVQKDDGWLALALGDDKSAYGWGFAGNRLDAERFALEACAKRTKNARLAVCFPTNGVAY